MSHGTGATIWRSRRAFRAGVIGAWLLLIASATESGNGSAPFQARPSPAASGIAIAARALIRDPRGLTRGPLTTEERRDLTRLYEGVNDAPFWVDDAGHPTRDAADALALFTGAASEGLDPLDYNPVELGRASAALAGLSQPPIPDAAAFEAALSANALRYFRHLHTGRVDPRTLGFRLSVPVDAHDFAAVLRAALKDHRVSEAAADFAPPLVLYRALRGRLVQYRRLAAIDTPTSFTGATTIRPGEAYEGAAALRRRLVAVGDLPDGTPGAAGEARYEGEIVEGVRRFQSRHGLASDGILGRQTQAALSVPLARRVRQIELALERLRWLPDLDPDRFLAVNIPMFRLWVWDHVPPNGAPEFGMNVIVGRALTRTPVFVDEMRYLIFRPYWNVPRSILASEMLPAMRRDPGYVARQNLEIVAGPGDDARPVAFSEKTLEQLQNGALRVRQRPGPNNALGLVKFVFPNDENVYLHSTPAAELFSRSRRDFSHGCVRVEDPVALAAWVLRGQKEWTKDRILAAMNGAQSVRVNLPRPIQVILFYVTAVVMPEDGTVQFADDVYGHDATLDRALSRR
jgi:murein L,D-transpeptidase YcbB/YkuD